MKGNTFQLILVLSLILLLSLELDLDLISPIDALLETPLPDLLGPLLLFQLLLALSDHLVEGGPFRYPLSFTFVTGRRRLRVYEAFYLSFFGLQLQVGLGLRG